MQLRVPFYILCSFSFFAVVVIIIIIIYFSFLCWTNIRFEFLESLLMLSSASEVVFVMNRVEGAFAGLLQLGLVAFHWGENPLVGWLCLELFEARLYLAS